MWVTRFGILCALVQVISATLTFDLEGTLLGQEFVTTKYSLYIGNFEEDCNINASVSILGPGEDICEPSTITTPVAGTMLLQVAVINLDCSPEEALTNAGVLGALAFIDVFPTTPGVFRYSRSWGQEVNANSVPFVQTGTEFLVGVLLNEALDLTSLNFQLNGCNDDSIWKECFNFITTAIQIPSGVTALCGAIYAVIQLQKIPTNPSTKPRIYILRYISFILFLSAFMFIFGYFTGLQYSWLTGSLFPDEIPHFLASLIMALEVHVILVTGVYWQALSAGMFKANGRYSSYWSTHFYHHPIHYLSYPILIFFTVGGYIGIVGLFEAPDTFTTISYILTSIQAAICVYFLVTGTALIRKLHQFILLQSQNATLEVAEKHRHIGCCDYMLLGVSAIKATALEEASDVDRNVLEYILWLLRCLFLFAVLTLAAYIPFPLLFFDRLPINTLEGDTSACNFSSFMAGCNFLKILALLSLVSGLGWVSNKPKYPTLTKFTVGFNLSKESTHTSKKAFNTSKSDINQSIPSIPLVVGLQTSGQLNTHPNLEILSPSTVRPSISEVISEDPGLRELLESKWNRTLRSVRASVKLFSRPDPDTSHSI